MRGDRSWLTTAHRLCPGAISIRHYINLLNEALKPKPEFDLEESSSCLEPTFWTSYLRLLDNLGVSFPYTSSPTFPSDVTIVSNPLCASAVTMDDVVNTAINSLLEQNADAWRTNALCAGIFRNRGQRFSGSNRYAGLCVRSSSGALQALYSPAWRILLSRVGPKILIHLLCKTTLLLVIECSPEGSENPRLQSNPIQTHGLLQISGPSPNSLLCPIASRRSRAETVVSFRRDVVHRTPRFCRTVKFTTNSDMKGALTLQGAFSNTSKSLKRPASCLRMNPGLPITHHLNRLLNTQTPFEMMMPIIFKDYIPESLRPKRARLGAANNRSFSVYSYDAAAAHLITSALPPDHNKKWGLLVSKVPKRLKRIMATFNKIQARLSQRNIRRMLGITCPLPSAVYPIAKRAKPSLHSLLELHSPPKTVAHFLVRTFREIIPKSLLGSDENRRKFEASVHSFIRHRRHKEYFDIEGYYAERALAVTDIDWLNTLKGNDRRVSGPSDLSFRQKRLSDVLGWLYRGFIIPLLEQSFFVTEGNHHKNRLFFFRREVWSLILDNGNKALLRRSRRFSVLPKFRAVEAAKQRSGRLGKLNQYLTELPVLYYHDLRYLPKGSDVRVIQRPRARPLMFNRKTSLSEKTKLIQGISKLKWRLPTLMKNILSILRAELKVRPELGGAAIFTSGAIHEKWLRLKEAWIARGKPRMYACCVDIAKSFDTVPLKTLVADVLPRVLSKERYPLVKMWLTKRDRLTEQIRYRKVTHACMNSGEEVSFRRLLREKLCELHPGSLFTDSAETAILRRSEILEFLDEFLTNNLVWVPHRSRKHGESSFAVQKQGVPQGHTLSPILTTLFYGHMEQEELKEFLGNESGRGPETQASLLVRFVDDTMFVTSREGLAQRFLARMVQGWKLSHGVVVNAGKTQASFSSGIGGFDDMRQLSWCGHLVDSQTLEMRGDYSKYLVKGSRLRDCVTVELEKECVQRWTQRSGTCFLPKISRLLLDGRINSAFTVAVNVYQAALLVALKDIAYMIAIGSFHHAHVIKRVLSNTVDQFIKLTGIVGQRARARKDEEGSRTFSTPLTRSEITFLTVHAFYESFIRRAAPRKGCNGQFKNGVSMCIDSLQLQLHSVLADLRVSRSWCIPRVADCIASKQCGVLWSIVI